MLIAIELEQKFSKQRIFEMYANEVYLGQRGSFTINGFGEACARLLQQGRQEPDAAGSRAAGGHDSAAELSFAVQVSQARAGAPQPGARLDGGDRRDHARPSRPRQGRAAEAGCAERGSQRCSVLCRPGEGPALAAVQRGRAEQPRAAHLHHHRSRLADAPPPKRSMSA